MPLGGDDLCAGADDHAFSDSRLNEWVSGVSDTGDATVLYAYVCFDDAEYGINDGCVCENQIQTLGSGGEVRLPHAIANDLATAEFYLVAVASRLSDEISLDFD